MNRQFQLSLLNSYYFLLLRKSHLDHHFTHMACEQTETKKPSEDVKSSIIQVLRDSKEATVKEIVVALRKKGHPAIKTHDVNPILYAGNGSIFCISTKIGGSPNWSLREGLPSPTISCPLMFATISPVCKTPKRLIAAIFQALMIEGISAVTCDTSTPNGRIAAGVAQECAMTVNGQPVAHERPSELDAETQEVSTETVVEPDIETVVETVAEPPTEVKKNTPRAAQKTAAKIQKAPVKVKRVI